MSDQEQKDYQTMSPEAFFSRERFVAVGMNSAQAARTATMMRISNTDWNAKGIEKKFFHTTMQNFLTEYKSRGELEGIRGVGPSGITAIANLLKQTGLMHF